MSQLQVIPIVLLCLLILTLQQYLLTIIVQLLVHKKLFNEERGLNPLSSIDLKEIKVYGL